MKQLVVFGMFVTLTGTLSAQEFPRFTFSAGAGFTTPVGDTGSSLDTGYNVRAGVGYNFLPWVGANLNFGFDNMGVNSTNLSNLGVGGGTVRTFSVTFDPIIHLTPKKRVDLYVTGGGGYFWEQTQFTNPGVAEGIFGNPWFGYYPGIYSTNFVVSDYSVNKPGLDGGVGVAFGSKWGGRFFAEARYVRIFSGAGVHTDYLPVTFGFRR
ncbi:MAG: outer membrane beta-barrel protein [Ignavibacteriota bacterium]